MLILIRKPHEGVFIDTPQGRVRVVVLSEDRGKVRVGIEAPQVVQVDREEVRLSKEVSRSGGRDVGSHSADPAAG